MRRGGGVWMAVLVLMGLLLWPMTTQALRHGEGGTDRVGLFRTLEIGPDEAAGDIACIFCTVRLEGDAHGDVAVMFSTLEVEPGREIKGDVAGLFSTLRMGSGSRIGGDLAWTLGTTSLEPGATVDGDRAVFGGSGVGWLVVLAPLLIVVGVVWLLIWIVRRVLTV